MCFRIGVIVCITAVFIKVISDCIFPQNFTRDLLCFVCILTVCLFCCLFIKPFTASCNIFVVDESESFMDICHCSVLGVTYFMKPKTTMDTASLICCTTLLGIISSAAQYII